MNIATTQHTLTPRQQDVLDWIAGFIDTHGYSPTVREIGSAYGWTNNGVVCHLQAIRRKGRITWVDHSPRTLRVVPAEETT